MRDCLPSGASPVVHLIVGHCVETCCFVESLIVHNGSQWFEIINLVLGYEFSGCEKPHFSRLSPRRPAQMLVEAPHSKIILVLATVELYRRLLPLALVSSVCWGLPNSLLQDKHCRRLLKASYFISVVRDGKKRWTDRWYPGTPCSCLVLDWQALPDLQAADLEKLLPESQVIFEWSVRIEYRIAGIDVTRADRQFCIFSSDLVIWLLVTWILKLESGVPKVDEPHWRVRWWRVTTEDVVSPACASQSPHNYIVHPHLNTVIWNNVIW